MMPKGPVLWFLNRGSGPHLANQSAGRYGPCVNGLPHLAATLSDLTHGRPRTAEIERLGVLVARHGTCAHPDGAIRMARSLLQHDDGEIAHHQRGRCQHDDGEARRRAG